VTGFHRSRPNDRVLLCEDVALTSIANDAGTPVYVYSAGQIMSSARA
jgi:diaminopimelate decarboxylase